MDLRCLFPNCGKANGCVWITTPLEVHGANQLLLTMLASLCILQEVFPHGWPVVPRSNDLQGECSPPNMTSTDAFMELCHDARTLIPAYAGEDRMSVAMSEQFSIYQGIPA